MAIDAIALLRIPFTALDEALERQEGGETDPQGEPALTIFRGEDGTSLGASPLEDATLLYTGLRFATEEAELSRRLHKALGALLERHRDSRGIYVFPDVAQPEATRYRELLEELGEGGSWIPLAPEGAIDMADLGALARQLTAALPPDAMAQLEAVAGSLLGGLGQAEARGGEPGEPGGERVGGAGGLDLGSLLGSMGGLDLAGMLSNAQTSDALLDAAQTISTSLGDRLPAALPSAGEAPELWAKAQQTAERLLGQDAANFAQMAAKLAGAPLPGAEQAAEEAEAGEDEPGGEDEAPVRE
ncbi:MAG: hypothetical protein OEY14_03980 [Myxococcales bacterium]|nr:hypothetical protein [Myxococcales bacterium]